MNWKKLAQAEVAPPLFHPGDGPFWADPYLSSHILYAHLDSSTDDGSRPLTRIAREAAWIDSLGAGRRGRLLDLGCGPGLYTRHWAAAGWQVSGIDLAPTSIKYAQEQAREEELAIDYRRGDFLDMALGTDIDLVTLIYGTWGVIAPDRLRSFLHRLHQSLRPGGLFVFDAFTHRYWESERAKDPSESWYVSETGGFWSKRPHLALIRRFDYPEQHSFTRQYSLVTDRGLRTYRMWYRWYDPAELTNLLEAAGFDVAVFGDLEGRPYRDDGDWMGVVAKKRGVAFGA